MLLVLLIKISTFSFLSLYGVIFINLMKTIANLFLPIWAGWKRSVLAGWKWEVVLVAEVPKFLELKQLCSKLQLAMFVHKRLCCEEEACCEAHSVGLHIVGKAKKDLFGPACSFCHSRPFLQFFCAHLLCAIHSRFLVSNFHVSFLKLETRRLEKSWWEPFMNTSSLGKLEDSSWLGFTLAKCTLNGSKQAKQTKQSNKKLSAAAISNQSCQNRASKLPGGLKDVRRVQRWRAQWDKNTSDVSVACGASTPSLSLPCRGDVLNVE